MKVADYYRHNIFSLEDPMEILDTLDILFEKVFPIIFLMILGIGGILCLFGVSTAKHMKWRRTTGWASVASLILVIVYPPIS